MLRLAIGIAVTLVLAPQPASACSPFCGVEMSPLGTSTDPAQLPVNGAFVAIPGGGTAVTSATLERTRDGVTETLPLVLDGALLALPDPRADDRLVITAMLSCGAAPTAHTTEIRLTPTAALPTTLGVLEVEASRATQVAVWDNRGGCTSDLASTAAPYDLALDPALAPWADALTTQAMLDDALWNDTPDHRVAAHFVFARCEALLPSQSAYDTSTGQHRLHIEGTLRGVPGTLASNEVDLELTCGSRSGSGSGCAAAPGGHSDLVWLGALGVLGARCVRRRGRAR